MIINGYRITWREWGWTNAVPVIHERCRLFGFLWFRWKRVAVMDNCCRGYLWAKYATPAQLQGWFTNALKTLLEYNEAWGVTK